MSSRGEDSKWTTFGWIKIRPAFLQRFHNPKFLTLCTILAQWAHGMVLSGFLPLSIRMLQSRFNMSRNEVSMISTSMEAATITALVIVSHKGNYGHKGQWIGWGLVIFCIGCLLWTIPQYLIGPHTFSDWVLPVLHCSSEAKEDVVMKGNLHMRVEHSKFTHYTFMFIFLAAQVMIGIGTAPLAVLAPAYIDESVSQRKSPFYLSTLKAGIGIGPLLGGALSAVYMDIYGDMGKVDTEGIQISPDHPHWYGAWWLGYLTGGIFMVLISFMYLGFARTLPGIDEDKANDIDQSAYHVEPVFDYSLTMIPEAVWSLLKNRTYTSLLGASMLINFLVGSTFVKFPYLMKSYYNISDNAASLIATFVVVLPQGLGALAIGFMYYHFWFKMRRMIQTCALLAFGILLLVPAFLLYCDNPKIAGVNYTLTGKRRTNVTKFDLSDGCNKGCFRPCAEYQYHPVCHKASGMSYFSPCFAGCTNELQPDDVLDTKVWSNCRCTQGNSPNGGTVVKGVCPTTCGKFKLFLFLLILIMFLSGMILPGTQQGYLRCVPHEQRVMGLTFGYVMSKLFGMIPGQYVMQHFVQQACQKEDKYSATCIISDNAKLAEVVTLLDAILVVGVLLCFISCVFVYKTKPELGLPHKMEEEHQETTGKSTDALQEQKQL